MSFGGKFSPLAEYQDWIEWEGIGMSRFFFIVAYCIAISYGAFAYELSNGYFQLSGECGFFDILRVDSTGKGKYGPNIIKSLSLGEPGEQKGLVNAKKTEKEMVFENLLVRVPFRHRQSESGQPIVCAPGGSLGMRFTVGSGRMNQVGVSAPTWHETESGCVLSLYRLSGSGLANKKIVVSRRFERVKDNSILSLTFEPQEAGEYYLEMSSATEARIGWWSAGKDVDPSMVGYVDGIERSDIDFTFEYSGFHEVAGRWTIVLDGPTLRATFEPTAGELPAGMEVLFVTPWKMSDYDVSMSPFQRLYTDSGQHILIHEFKRRPNSDHLRPCNWVYAMAWKGSDLRFNLSPGQAVKFEFEEDAATWRLNGASLNIEVVPHNEKLPKYYPVFYSSDQDFAKKLNEFYYSHALNFGVGTPPEWKEWLSRIFCWTANPMRDQMRDHFLNPSIRDDGYVRTWGSQDGWPFPFKDEDKDGRNDYDTRHFTTNSCFILGAYHYFAWTRDEEFLRAVMPRLRLAMSYLLRDLHGEDGIIIIDALGHEGRHRGIGSNYWDILPFGYKDAFCNTYYYEALRAMGELEEYCQRVALDDKGVEESSALRSANLEKRTPEFYERLRRKVRRQYNTTFWDPSKGRYVGCVDVDGVKHDYGFTFVNVEAMTYGLADQAQADKIYHWMENEPTSTGKADTYSAWIFAPRSNTIHNPGENEAGPGTAPSWWFFGWSGTPYGDQCQDGGAILYTSYYDLMARVKFLGADNAYKRFKEILNRYWMPDRLCGGSPLYRGEKTQGGPGGGPGSVGVEGEFPESGLVPCAFLNGFLGIEADIDGLKIRPRLPSSVKYAGVRNICYAGGMYDIRVTHDSVEVTPLDVANPVPIKKKLEPDEVFVLKQGTAVSR